MENKMKLVDDFDVISRHVFTDKTMPDFILSNLNSRFAIRDYQREAFARLRYYLNGYKDKKTPVHLLFHMATGCGKTLIMAADILYLHSLGYRNFIFFVNSTNIIEKTKGNFLDKGASKYLFADRIVFGDREIEVRQVDNFEAANKDNINILFTTIQGLHSNLTAPRENAITKEDFKNIKVVFLSDEAHHINALTKAKLDEGEKTEKESWENTVNKIFNANTQNVMLEYTATVELKHEAVARKYDDKIIYQYTLKNFREDGFSKEVQLLQSDWAMKDRALQAIILSQYRRKVAEKNKIQLKPVILFKSKQINDSVAFEQLFHTMVKNLAVADIKKLATGSNDGIMKQVFNYLTDNKITPTNLIKEIKEDFAPEKCLIINSKADSEAKQIKVNTLEDYNNEIRAIFTTNMLNEGWDVLNLFDIVRLYETRDAKAGKAGSTTISEAQLIGRGARYYPFQMDDKQEKDKRKFDGDLDNELRVLEELHYHSLTDSRYIAELRSELINIGIAADNKVIKTVHIKDEVKKTKFWKNGLVFVNERQKTDYSKVKNLSDIVQSTLFTHKIKTGYSSESGIFGEEQELKNEELKKKKIKLNNIEPHILRKAIDKIEAYAFSNLINTFPNLKSIAEFITSENYAGLVEVEISAKNGKVDNLTNADKLEIALDVLKELATKIATNKTEFIGTKKLSNKVYINI
jgi:type III restriction enzyme